MDFVVGHPACKIGGSLVVSDVHLGFEFELQAKGVRIAPDARASALAFNRMMGEAECDSLVVLGDFKHDVRGYASRERRLVSDFVHHCDAGQITVVKGNHDSLLESFGKFKVVAAAGMVLEADGVAYGLHHGHAWPDKALFKADFLLMGNNHPAVEFTDRVGFRWVEKAWISGRIKLGRANQSLAEQKGVVDGQPVIVFPAFSPLYPGTAFNRLDAPDLLGPLFKSRLFDLDGSQAITLAGVRLGKIRQLRQN